MPTQKDLKRIVRSRMRKTGESYTAARSHVLTRRGPREAARPTYAERAGMADEKVKAKTGRDWTEWVRTLDAAGAATRPRSDIVRHVADLGTPDWWTQMVTVGYERIKGLREIGQRHDGGYAASKSRTFAVPVARLYGAFADARRRKRWLADPLTVRGATANKRVRLAMRDGSVVEVTSAAKGAAKSTVAVEHTKLAGRAAVANAKTFWADRLDALDEVLRARISRS
jgi:hypothetical protein